MSVEVTSNAHFSADTWRAEFAETAMPPGLGAGYWSASEYDRVDLSAWLDDGIGLTRSPLITGQVDEVEYDPTRRKLMLSGRDLSAALIDAKTTEKFQNLKAYEIAQALALRHGLDSDVTATGTLSGKYYQIDHTTLAREESEWDLLCYLAEREGFDVWVRGQTLYFQPPVQETQAPYELHWDEAPTSNCEHLTLSRSQTLAKDVVVKVRSWNQAQARAFTVVWRGSKKGRSKPAGETEAPAQTYTYTVPNLTREQALKYAQTMAAKISRHERLLTAELPGDGDLTTRSLIRLSGTGTDWDQNYYPESVTRRLSFDEGYAMSLRAKNHSPISEVLL